MPACRIRSAFVFFDFAIDLVMLSAHVMFNRPRATRFYESRIGMIIFSMVSPILRTGIRFGL